MLDAIKKGAEDLSEMTFEYPGHASALYLMGDGEDTHGNAAQIRQFLASTDAEHGLGEHMKGAIIIGDETMRQTLAALFGDEHTAAAAMFEDTVEKFMEMFDDDITAYLEDKTETQ